MTFDETIAAPGASIANAEREPYSAAWWHDRTAEELRDIIKRGFAGGDAFQGAVAETERRAREATKRLREAAAVEAERRKKLKKVIILGAIACVTMAASASMWFAL